MLGERRAAILRLIIEYYIKTGEPIGSKTLCNLLPYAVSSATIRNEMAHLSNLGYLEQRHTSGGRVPGKNAYRFYVDHLMEPKALSPYETAKIDERLSVNAGDAQRLLADAADLLADATHCAAFSCALADAGDVIQGVQLIPAGGGRAMLVMLAAASNAIIVAFNTGVDPVAKENADRDGVEIRSYNIIYDAIEEIEAAMRGMRAPKYRDVDTGTAEVREVYKISSAGTIAGSLVTSGNIRREGKVRLVRDGKQLADVPLKGLKRFKDDVKDVSSGYECGISLEGWDDIQPGDVLECYVVEEYRD